VEDNPTDVFVIKEVIKRSGLGVQLRVANNGEEALTFLEHAANDPAACPALILLDLNLPRVPGLEILRRLRSEERYGHTPVIVVTSSTAEKDRVAVEQLGAQGYFQKPNDLQAYSQLVELLKHVLGPVH
jgi:CheY-like chemotaxis protein